MKYTIFFISSIFFLMSVAASAQNTQSGHETNVKMDTLTSEVSTPKPDVSNVQLSPKEDAAINKTITDFIKKNVMLSKTNIKSATKNGDVTLTGRAHSDSQVSRLVEFVQSVIGVKNINTNITVDESKEPMNDTLISAKIRGLFIREEIFGTKDIASINLSVETKDGIVYLTGIVDNQQQIQNAIKLIEGMEGVKKVVYSVHRVTPNAGNNQPANGTTTQPETKTSASETTKTQPATTNKSTTY